MQGSPIGWIGGKRLLRQEIVNRFPAHTTYVEVFCGAAWVLFGKYRATSKAEVINDVHGELTNFFRCVRERPLGLIEKLKFRLASTAEFGHEKVIRQGGTELRCEAERAAAVFWMLKNAFGGKSTPKANFGYSLMEPSGFRSDLVGEIIESAHERLKGVYVFNEDFERLIRRFDRPDTLFYCDPPYYGSEKEYEYAFTAEDHERLARTLRGIAGNFLLSYNDHERIRELYDWATIETVTTRYSLARSTEARQSVTELLVRNYDL